MCKIIQFSFFPHRFSIRAREDDGFESVAKSLANGFKTAFTSTRSCWLSQLVDHLFGPQKLFKDLFKFNVFTCVLCVENFGNFLKKSLLS